MPLLPSDIQAVPGSVPAAAPETAAPPATPDAAGATPSGYSGEPGSGGSNPAAMLETLPEELLKDPLIFNVAKGQPGAVSAPMMSKDPMVTAVVKNAQALVAAGFGIYKSHDKKTAVLFNTQTVHPGDLAEADHAGKLADLAPPFNTIQTAAAPAGVAATPGGAPPVAGSSIPASQPAASVQNKLATIRGKNLQPISPTGGAAPGAGGILNSILRPAV